MAMDPELREKVRRFHLKVTLAGALLLIAGSLAGAYIVFFRNTREFPPFLLAVARWVSRF